MSKIIIFFLALAAFSYALWLVILKKQLPDPKQSKGLKRRFFLATLLFVGLFGTVSCTEKPKTVAVCYLGKAVETPPLENSEAGANFTDTLKAVWRTLDPTKAEEFRNRLETAVEGNVIRRKTAKMLAIAYDEIAYHKKRIRGKDGVMVTCYRPTHLGSTLRISRESVLKQIDLLDKARKSGTIDNQTATKARLALAREVEMLYRAKNLKSAKGRFVELKLIEEYNTDTLIATDSASVAAGMIVEMEDGSAENLTSSKRLAKMKQQVESLLQDEKTYSRGPAGNDWMDPGINPNIYAVLEKAGLISNKLMVTCYEPMASPVKARSDELLKLQQELLDKNVNTGVLGVEIADKATAANDKEKIDYATEANISIYQKKIRRIMRMLYKHGELPSSFVKKIEIATDVEIISFDPDKAFRNDVRWHLRSLLQRPIGDDIMNLLEKRKLIPKKRNNRYLMNWRGYDQPILVKDRKKRLAEFKTLLDKQTKPENSNRTYKILFSGLDWKHRVEVINICTALIEGNFATVEQLRPIEDLIGRKFLDYIKK
jgi:hypothetical protein